MDEDGRSEGKALDKLAAGVAVLDRSQRIRKPDREGGASHRVKLEDLTALLGGRGRAAGTGAGRLAERLAKEKGLNPPLDKRTVDEAQRKTGYTEVVSLLDQWEPVVTSNRAKEHRRFPEVAHGLDRKPVENFLKKFTLSSELEKQLEVLGPPATEPEEVDEFPLTLEEIVERRREIARLRAKQSYKEAEAKRRGKIKSKKFRRVQRKEKIKQQLKEFEDLQKTNPEEALRRLQQLEKTRAQERASLRHKSTGQWAKNKLVRAKYNKETRQELAEQLSIGRSLTQKVTNEPESESDKEDDDKEANVDPTNPWLVNIGKPQENIDDFVSGYKKYWETKNNVVNTEKNEKEPSVSEIKELPVKNGKLNVKTPEKIPTLKKKNKPVRVKATSDDWQVEDLAVNGSKGKINASKSTNQTIDDMFDELDQTLQGKIKQKIKQLKRQVSSKSKSFESGKDNTAKKYEVDLSFKKSVKRPIIDEELLETSAKDKPKITKNLNDFSMTLDKSADIDKIDPTNFVAPKPKHLPTSLPDVDMEECLDNTEATNRFTIVEAFEDDDIVAEFQEEKENERNANKPKAEDLALPGWGAWVTKTNVNKPRKTKRLLLNAPKPLRKDDKKSEVIINENVSQLLKEHQVSELPFPFTKVSDFEATIRAPIGNTFITQTAHKKLTKPALVTKTGIPIEPLDESILIDRKKMKWNSGG